MAYGAAGLGGIQYEFDQPTGLDRQRIGVLVAGGYGNALDTLFSRDYPNWHVRAERQLPDRRQSLQTRRPPAPGCSSAAESGPDSRVAS